MTLEELAASSAINGYYIHAIALRKHARNYNRMFNVLKQMPVGLEELIPDWED